MFFTYQQPNFDTALTELKTLLEEAQKEIDTLLTIELKNYANFVKPYQETFETIEHFTTPFSILNSTKNEEKIEALYTQMLPLLTEFDTDIKQNIELFDIFKAILKKEESTLNTAQIKVLTNEIRDFELSGSSLPKDKQEQIKTINLRLSEIQNEFSQNILKATAAFEITTEDYEDVKELPVSDLAMAKVEEAEKTSYKFTLQPPSFMSYMTFGSNPKLRQELYEAYTSRAPENEAILEEILALRAKEAELLEFDSYAALSLETKMADKPSDVIDFLEELLENSLAQAKNELSSLQEFAQQQGNSELKSWDTGYYSKKLEEERYSIDEDAFRPYFEQGRVLNGLFDFLDEFFGIQFIKQDEQAWDEKVRVYHLKRSGETFGKIYIDLESRSEKKGGAWMGDWRTFSKTSTGATNLPIAYIVCNFAPSSAENPSLLKHDDVVTLFHEMGHALHHLFSVIEEPFVSGISGVEWDAVEFPSQFLESFAYEKEVLKRFAIHHQKESVLPDDMIDNLIRAKNFQSALGMLRQLEFSLFDMKIHLKKMSASEVQETLDELRKTTALITPPASNKFQHGFSHIFAGGYAAGYYSYKWAEVLSADAFYSFIDNTLFDKEKANKLIDNFFSQGGAKGAMEHFTDFLGRTPQTKALLRLNGIEA
jgi:oligopeptidase A